MSIIQSDHALDTTLPAPIPPDNNIIGILPSILTRGWSRFASMVERLYPRQLGAQFDEALNSAHAELVATKTIGDANLLALRAAWGNSSWAADLPYLRTITTFARNCEGGSILECGSGLTTILLAMTSSTNGGKVTTLEHDAYWLNRVKGALSNHPEFCKSLSLVSAPLRDHGNFNWYDFPQTGELGSIDLVVCDGPPGWNYGGRYGLLPIMASALKPGSTVILDDLMRTEEQGIVNEWARRWDLSVKVIGEGRKHAVITCG